MLRVDVGLVDRSTIGELNTRYRENHCYEHATHE